MILNLNLILLLITISIHYKLKFNSKLNEFNKDNYDNVFPIIYVF